MTQPEHAATGAGEIRAGDCALENQGDAMDTKALVRVVRIFKGGGCHVIDDDGSRRRRDSHVSKLVKYDEAKP